MKIAIVLLIFAIFAFSGFLFTGHIDKFIRKNCTPFEEDLAPDIESDPEKKIMMFHVKHDSKSA